MKSAKKAVTTSEAAKILAQKHSIALFSHTNPDGDTIGSSVALYLALKKLNKNVDIFCDSYTGPKLASFERTSEIKRTFSGKYDLLVAVDCGDVFRLGNFSSVYANFGETLTVDHHGGEFFSDYNCILKYGSACQIVYEIIKEMNVDIDNEMATYLYMGLCTDTMNFTQQNTDPSALSMGAELLKMGADNQRVIRVLLKDLSLSELKLRAKVISRIRTYYDDRMVLLYIAKSELESFGLDQSATTGIVQYAIDLEGVRVGVCMCEKAENVYKVSMRGKGVAVRKICEEFGGGGHEFASGCVISGFFEDVVEKIVRVAGFYI